MLKCFVPIFVYKGQKGLHMKYYDIIASVNNSINGFVWGTVGVWLLLIVGVIMTCMTKVFQVTHFAHWMKMTLGRLFDKKVTAHSKEKASISQFQALCTALAATVGVGNIAGVSAAIMSGGPGAIFWMWVAAFFGMMTNYSENVLGIYFRRKNTEGEWSGGPMYYLQDGLGKGEGFRKGFGKFLAIVFSICALLASFGIGNMGQVNKIVINFTNAFDIKFLSGIVLYGNGDSKVTLYMLLVGVALMIVVASVVLGGIKRIAEVAEKIIPFMVVAFMLGSIIVIVANAGQIIPVFGAILGDAFTGRAVWGAAVGVSLKEIITIGCKRGVFSNEAGLGSSVMVHSNSNVIEPVRQGMWGIFEVFMDTMVVCTLTAFTILTSGVINLETGVAVTNVDATLVAEAFNTVFSIGNFHFGKYFIAIAILLFAFTTILGWSHYGTKAVEYLATSEEAKTVTIIYKIVFIVMILSGALMTTSLAWDISDTFNGLMMIPNLIGVVFLSPLVMKITRNYVDRHLKHKTDVKPMFSFDPEIQKAQEELAKTADEEDDVV